MLKPIAALICTLFLLTSAFAAEQTKADRAQLKQAKQELAAQTHRQNANKHEQRRWLKAQNKAMKKLSRHSKPRKSIRG